MVDKVTPLEIAALFSDQKSGWVDPMGWVGDAEGFEGEVVQVIDGGVNLVKLSDWINERCGLDQTQES